MYGHEQRDSKIRCDLYLVLNNHMVNLLGSELIKNEMVICLQKENIKGFCTQIFYIVPYRTTIEGPLNCHGK